MRKTLTGVAIAVMLSVSILAGTADAERPTCNWGHLTAAAISDGFDQGGHASDPSGDGRGPGTADEPRVGLANVVERGNLDATCQLIESLL